MNKIMKIFCFVAVLVVLGSIFGGVVSAKNASEGLTKSVADAEDQAVVNYITACDSAKSDPLTFTVYATHEGKIGKETANGHKIQSDDNFVALPSTKVLCSNGGHEFEVRISYKGKSTVAPIWDVGPWNTKDDYWNPSLQREMWKALSQGKPEAQAAYQEGYNNGKDESGRTVLNPAGIDLAEGTWEAIGITDGKTNDWVTVEFLWAPDVSVRDSSPYFTRGSTLGNWHKYNYDGTPEGYYKGHTYLWTYVGGMYYGPNDPRNDPNKPDCWAEFKTYLSQAGEYDVYACFYADPQNSKKVPHTVYYDGGSTTILVDQCASNYFIWKERYLGTWNFKTDADTRVVVTDATGEPLDKKTTLNVDTIKFVKKESSTITVTSPNGWEHWPIGRNREIKWTSSGVTGNVKIDLSKNGGSSWETIFSNTANDGSQWWTVTGTETTQARIRVVSLQNTAISDMSNANFKIFSITATVTSPSSETNWPAGSTQTITWSMSGDTSNLDYFWVAYSLDGCQSWTNINTAVASARSLNWAIPNDISYSQCKIRVRVLDADGWILAEGVSDTFTILPSPQTGSIKVITNLDKSTFAIIGPKTYQDSGKSWSKSDAPAGTYTITYGEVSGYITPPSEPKTLSPGGSIMFSGKYSNIVKLSCTIHTSMLGYPK